jgi:hypothetical protein
MRRLNGPGPLAFGYAQFCDKHKFRKSIDLLSFSGCTFPADQRCKFFLWAEVGVMSVSVKLRLKDADCFF